MIFKKKESNFTKISTVVFILVIVIIDVVPILLIVSNSFKPSLDIKTLPPNIIFNPTLKHFKTVLSSGNFDIYFKNSLIVATITTAISIIVGIFGAYGLWLARYSKWGRKVSDFILLGKLVPSITILIPLNMLLYSVKLNGTYVGPILAHSSVNLPFVIWLILGFIKQLPAGLYESAQLEGASTIRILVSIFVPLLLPAIGSAFILSMQYSWNELLFSLQLTSMDTYTLPVGIARSVGAVAIDWGRGCASATIAMLPIIIIGFIMQKYFIAGMTAGAIKE
ncbi:carbohydrate ABC transporter permease [Flexilinea flocculi]|uniref:ABC-type glycerol-3-phosphate transport system, permease component n=1 Tax=Flexilinea flocculi TaxID=1678840 RepID=A0A0S7BPQ9_9CHLR|nr:carbohydrate ABC transporter permease [Flexilinea flocculi]GAP40247.1 ABC-type glycerol-3-phosphate transport system, permease component [Flexilinea flocculi]